MPGQGVIVGVGSIDYPAEFEGADRRNLSSFGVSKVVTITSTYDHRIIQGAESGTFLKRVHELLLGEHGFYDDIFHSLGMPYEAVKWRPDTNPIDHEEAMLGKQMAVAKLIRVHRVRGHLIADLDPLRWKEPHTPRELDPATYGLTIWDLDREFLTDGVGGVDKMRLGDLLGVLRDAYCRTIGVEYMHIQNTDEQIWIQNKVETQAAGADQGAEGPDPRASERGGVVREVPRHEVRRHEAVRHRGCRVGDPDPRRDPLQRGRRLLRRRRARHGPPWPAERAVEHHGQELRGDLLRVRGPRRPEHGAGVGRRQVPPRHEGQVRQPGGRRRSRSSWPPTRATSRRSVRSCSAWSAPSRTRSSRPVDSPCCRCSSTAMPRSPARASSPRGWR